STSATSLSYSGNQVDAGTYFVTAHYAGDQNHDPSDGSAVAITINRATPTILLTPIKAPYDGNPHPITVEVGGVGTVDLGPADITYYSGTAQTSAPVDVGVYGVTATFAGNTDYAPASVTNDQAITITAPASGGGAKQFVLDIRDPNTPGS